MKFSKENDAKVRYIAHRGVSYKTPENTLEAVEMAWKLSDVDVEIDVHLTADGKIVLCHDGNTQRTTGVDLEIAQQPLAALQQLDAGSWKGPEWTGTKLPTLDAVLATIPEDRRLFVEIKCGPEILPVFKDCLHKSEKQTKQVVVISFSEEVIHAVKQQLPELKAYWLAGFRKEEGGEWMPTIDEIIAKAKFMKADGVDLCAQPPVLNIVAVKKIREAGLEWYVWTVDDPVLAAECERLGVDGITTNRPQEGGGIAR